LYNTNTRYTPLISSQKGNFKVSKPTNNNVVNNSEYVISSDGILYTCLKDNNVPQNYIYAYNLSDASIKWILSLDSKQNNNFAPAIGRNGTIYFGATSDINNSKIYAINPNGTKKWEYDISNSTNIYQALIIDSNENIIFTVEQVNQPSSTSNNVILYSITRNKQLNWSYNLGNKNNSTQQPFFNGTSIDNTGNIYITQNLTENQDTVGVLTILNSNGNLLAKYISNNGRYFGCPVINNNLSKLYILANFNTTVTLEIFNLPYNGSNPIIKSINTNKFVVASGLSIDSNNNLYFKVNYNNFVYLISTDSIGNKRFELLFNNYIYNNIPATISISGGTPIIGGDDTIYMSIIYYFNSVSLYVKSVMYAINFNGTIKWSKLMSNSLNYNVVLNTPVIGSDGTLYASLLSSDNLQIPTIQYNNIYAFT
jgi:hypothetical protein